MGAWSDPSVFGSGHPENMSQRWRVGLTGEEELAANLAAHHSRATHLCIHAVILTALQKEDNNQLVT